MEPIKIQIEVNLGEATLDILKTFAPALGASEVKTPAPAPEKKAKPAAAPAPAPVEEPAPAEPVMEDLPPDDAPDPVKPTPTEDDARQAVKAARSRGVSAKVIKDYMKDSFNIATSVECPAERRQELIDGLNRLAA